MIANTLPLLTWRWLKVNDALIELPEVLEQVTEIAAKENDEISTLFDFNKIESGKDSRHIKIKITAEKNSKVDLYYVSRCTDENTSLTDIEADVAEGATVNFIQIESGAKRTVTNYTANLNGRGATTNIDSVYFAGGEDNLDIFYHVNHIGEETVSNILVNGALKDKARKTFKGTIDFKRGSKGSKGSEEEFATLLDEDVRSVAVPVLLCVEDDVEGLHAASAGKIDQDKLFYIMSRGLSHEQAKKMLVETQLFPTIDKLPDKDLVQEIWRNIEKRI
ncbi:SufB/SufD family protein [Peptostreptococcus sp. D1]|uniref:SufB/SufD family protein n=1 Tax=Peptostreptococcus sp. D1 TaxID=72304 RepID=UPI0008E4A847|nr:SufD family Fe-S cluster assembly protein [Peptostreptococcus sp. D1]SFE82602.1 Uncharacterized protein family (UPF0051) [Peptostreptococcus sp. D1]